MELIPLILILFMTMHHRFSLGQDGHQDSAVNEKFNDYEIYKVIDNVREHLGHTSLYDLFGVKEGAPADQISKSLRRFSLQLHPDKQKGLPPHLQKQAEMKYKMIQYAATLLRDDEGRKRYQWLMHEAPPWYRRSVLVRGAIVKQAIRLSVLQVVGLIITFGTVCQLVVMWTRYFYQIYLRWWSARQIAFMGEKEVKRIKKRLETGNHAYHL